MRSTLLNKIEECAAKQQLEKEKEERIQKALWAICYDKDLQTSFYLFKLGVLILES